jgi:hypothetical protein
MRKENKMGQTKHKDIWQFLEDDTIYHPEAVKALFDWSLNFDHSDRPFNLFCDIVGYSEEHYGTRFWTGKYSPTIGYMEAAYLGDALNEWGMRPTEVEQWITTLMSIDEEYEEN